MYHRQKTVMSISGAKTKITYPPEIRVEMKSRKVSFVYIIYNWRMFMSNRTVLLSCSMQNCRRLRRSKDTIYVNGFCLVSVWIGFWTDYQYCYGPLIPYKTRCDVYMICGYIQAADHWPPLHTRVYIMTRKWFPHYWPFVWETTGHRWIPPTKGQ